MNQDISSPDTSLRQDDLFEQIAAEYGPALGRLARGYEADPESRRDLLQDIQIALWRSLAGFDGRCSMRTWVYRVAHNVAASHVIQGRRAKSQQFLSLHSVDTLADQADISDIADRCIALERLMTLIQRLNPLDRQVILLYLEGAEAVSIAEITGLSAGNVATKIHRIKTILIRRFHEGRTS